MQRNVRLGIIGMGAMGNYHASYIIDGKVSRCDLTAVSDVDKERLNSYRDVEAFTDSRELIRSGLVDAVLVVAPHYLHTPIGIDALHEGLHVLVEKPISVHKSDCERLIAAHTNKRQIFAAMFNMRKLPIYAKLKSLIATGEIGDMIRVNWVVTDWFRTGAYYASGGWRGTWAGEGGGVLLNQCPHQLDLLQWLCGMPSKVRAFCGFGVRHDIEVEDQVTAYLEYPNGATGVFIASTGEFPGTNRLEIAGERGRIVVEDKVIRFTRSETSVTEFSRTTTDSSGEPELWNVEVPAPEGQDQHALTTQNFVDAILDGVALIAPAEEGINSVELANAMLYSSLMEKTIELPLDGRAFEATLGELTARSTRQQRQGRPIC